MSSRKGRGIKPSSQPRPANEVLKEQGINRPVSVSFKHVQPGDKFCLSLCEREEVQSACKCLQLMTTMNWSDVLKTGGKGPNKTGLAYTPYQDNALRRVQRPLSVSPELTISGVRASQKMRIFGVYINHIFYVLWFDPNHEIVPV